MLSVQIVRRYIGTLVIATVSLIGCDEADRKLDTSPAIPSKNATGIERQPSPEIAADLERAASRESLGLKDAKTIVHRAYEYKGYSYFEPREDAKLIAVDVEFQGYNTDLDLDDVDIVDGASNENFGSDPHIAALTSDGKLAANPDDSSWPTGMTPLRTLLIYAVPKGTSSIKLSYWGQELTNAAIPLVGEGPTLSNPVK